MLTLAHSNPAAFLACLPRNNSIVRSSQVGMCGRNRALIGVGVRRWAPIDALLPPHCSHLPTHPLGIHRVGSGPKFGPHPPTL